MSSPTLTLGPMFTLLLHGPTCVQHPLHTHTPAARSSHVHPASLCLPPGRAAAPAPAPGSRAPPGAGGPLLQRTFARAMMQPEVSRRACRCALQSGGKHLCLRSRSCAPLNVPWGHPPTHRSARQTRGRSAAPAPHPAPPPRRRRRPPPPRRTAAAPPFAAPTSCPIAPAARGRQSEEGGTVRHGLGGQEGKVGGDGCACWRIQVS